MSVVASVCPLNNVLNSVWIQNAHSNKPYVYTKTFLTLLQLLFFDAVNSDLQRWSLMITSLDIICN